MKRVLLFAAKTGYQTRVYAEAAERLGIEVLLVTDRCHVLETSSDTVRRYYARWYRGAA